MTCSCQVPFPRWGEMVAPGELENLLAQHGVEQANALGKALSEMFMFRARDEEANYEYLCERICGLTDRVEDLENPPGDFATGTVDLSLIGSLQDNTDLDLAWALAYDEARQICFVGLYSGGSDNRITAVDVSDATSPAVLGTLVDGTNLASAYSMVYDSTRQLLYVPLSDRFTVVDVSTPASMSIEGSLSDTTLTQSRGLTYDEANQQVYLCSQIDDTFSVIDVSTPSSPSVTGQLKDSVNLRYAAQVAYDSANSLCYVTCQIVDRLTVVDVSTPASPSVVGSIADTTNLGTPGNVAYNPVDEVCYVIAEGPNLLTVVDVSTPSGPVVGDTFSFSTEEPFGLYFDPNNDLCYISISNADRAYAIDVSDAANLVAADTLTSATEVNSGRQLDYDVSRGIFFVASNSTDRVSCVDVFVD